MPESDFTIDERLDAQLARVAEELCSARYVVAFTGAGMSVESGIPPFRGEGGLWTKYGEPPMDGYQKFMADPAEAWREQLNPSAPWAIGLAETLGNAKPNDGHHALAELERRGIVKSVITQNVDDLHRQAGSREVHEIHGNYHWLRCVACEARFAKGALEVDPEALPPHCPECGGVVKNDTVQFGEPIPPAVLEACQRETFRCDAMLMVGTSATVYPAAGFPMEVRSSGGALFEINPEPSELSSIATHSLRGPAGATLTRLLDHLPAEVTTR